MKVTLRGKSWSFQRRKKKGQHGSCDPPDAPNKRILIDPRLEGKEELETILHELLHACYFDLDEEPVATSAADIASVLWKLGYRKSDDCG